MCIAILTLPGKAITAKVFDQCFRNNSNGVGFAYIHPKTKDVTIDRGYMTAESARKQYFRLVEEYGKDYPMLIHFRAATVGGKGADNCHPFPVKGGAMIHNGTFWHDKDARKSDSRMLAEAMHDQLHVANLKANKEQFQEAFGYNRVAFLFKGGEYVIISEEWNGRAGQFGQWNDGIWYSNGGWDRGYGDYCGDDEDIRELANLDSALWGRKK